jgi:dTDP-4-amino-4,6-dideoxygalactose transaminase
VAWTIPLFDTDFGDAELDAIQRPVKAGWLTMGEETLALEARLRERLGVDHCFATSNGTAALHMACAALGLRPGDEVLCPTLTFVASANAIRYTGATPVFCESCGEGDLNIDPNDARSRITDRTRAMMLVHYAGHPCDVDALGALAREHDLAIVEDCAHAVFSAVGDRWCGTIGDVGCYSFFSNKNITCGEGGAVVTRCDDLAENLRLFRSHGMTTLTLDRHKGHAFTYDVVTHGYNYRIDEIRAALLGVQLDRLEGFLARRREVFGTYCRAFAGSPVVVPFADRTAGTDWDRTAVHILPVILPDGTNRRAVMEAMRDAGIQTSIHYRPVHTLAAFTDGGTSLHRTEGLAARELTLPLFPRLTASEVQTVAEALLASV